MYTIIDAKSIIASKNRKLSRRLPRFLIHWFENVIHQDEINQFISLHQHESSFEFCMSILKEFNISVTVSGFENITSQPDKCLLVANHPLGGLDAIVLIHLLKEKYPNLTFIVNDLLLGITNLQKHFIGVNKVGKTASQSLQKVENLFASNKPICLFPSGLVSRKVNGIVSDLEWKETFVKKAIQYAKSVTPIHIDGKLSSRFYRLANLRVFLGIGFNIEMLFLVDELFKLKNTEINVTIGKPIPPETFTTDKSNDEWSQWVKAKVYKLNSDI